MMTPEEIDRVQVVMLKKKLSDEHCARIVGRSTKDWKNIVMKKKSEDPSRIAMMLHSLENYE